jgi:hypothetical protein
MLSVLSFISPSSCQKRPRKSLYTRRRLDEFKDAGRGAAVTIFFHLTQQPPPDASPPDVFADFPNGTRVAPCRA